VTVIWRRYVLILWLCYQLKSSDVRADCARPLLWAAETKKVVDMFIIFTDQPCSSATADDDVVTPVKALHQYCDVMSRPSTRYDGIQFLFCTRFSASLFFQF